MSSKIGRPTNSLKEKNIKFRADNDFEEKLKFCSTQLNLNRSETLRYCVLTLYRTLKEDKGD